MLLLQLFLAFLRPNLLGYGGGPAVIPLIEAEVTNTYGWMSRADFADALAIGNTLPGPIATKMAAYIGWKVGGLAGSVVALLATVVPTAVVMIALAALLYRYREAAFVKGMIKGVKPVVFVLFVLLALDFARFAWPPAAGWLPAVFAVVAFIAIFKFHVHQAMVIAAALVLGGLLLR